MLFLCYPRCSTCQKAKKWLEEHPLAKLELEQQLLHELVTRFPEEPLDMLQFAK